MPKLKRPRLCRDSRPRLSHHSFTTRNPSSGQQRKDAGVSCCAARFASLDSSERLSLRELRSLWTEQVPRFPVLVVHASFAVVAAAEQEAGGSQEGFEGEYVPGVLGDDVGG